MGILTVPEVVVEAGSHYCVDDTGVAAGPLLKVEEEHNGGLLGHASTPPWLTLALASLEEGVVVAAAAEVERWQLLRCYS